MFELDLDELEEQVSEVLEMLRDLGVMAQQLIVAQSALRRKYELAQESFDEAVRRKRAWDNADFGDMVLPL